MSWTPIVAYKFVDVDVDTQEKIKQLVQTNIDGKLDSYLKKVYKNKADAEVRISYTLTLNKQKKYECHFIFDFDGEQFVYDSKVAFKFAEDLINHAFKHFKEYLSKHEINEE